MAKQPAYIVPRGYVLSCLKLAQACFVLPTSLHVLLSPRQCPLLNHQRSERFIEASHILSLLLYRCWEPQGPHAHDTPFIGLPWIPDHLCAHLPIGPEVIYDPEKRQTEYCPSPHSYALWGSHLEASSLPALSLNILLFYESPRVLQVELGASGLHQLTWARPSRLTCPALSCLLIQGGEMHLEDKAEPCFPGYPREPRIQLEPRKCLFNHGGAQAIPTV